MDPNRLRSRTRVTTFKFQDALGLKNRLRSRTRVTTFKFQSALNLKNRFRSRTRVATLTTNYVLDARSRACIQRGVFRIHFRGAHQTYFEICGSSIGV